MRNTVNSKLQIAQVLANQIVKGVVINTQFQSPESGYLVRSRGFELRLQESDEYALQAWVTEHYPEIENVDYKYFESYIKGFSRYYNTTYQFRNITKAKRYAKKNGHDTIFDVVNNETIEV